MYIELKNCFQFMKLEKITKDKVLVFQSVPQPAILRKKGHARKPSDGAKQDLFPIVEDKVISDNHHRNLESSTSSEDTVKANTAKEVSACLKTVALNLAQMNIYVIGFDRS